MREHKVSDAAKSPEDRNLSFLVCLCKYVKASNEKREFCTSQMWSYKRLSSYGLACGSWLYELSGMQPWFEGCIVSFQSETSQLHISLIWGTSYHPLFKLKSSLIPVLRHCLLTTAETRRAAVRTYPSHFHKSISNCVAFIQTHIYPENQMESRRSCCDIVGSRKRRRSSRGLVTE